MVRWKPDFGFVQVTASGGCTAPEQSRRFVLRPEGTSREGACAFSSTGGTWPKPPLHPRTMRFAPMRSRSRSLATAGSLWWSKKLESRSARLSQAIAPPAGSARAFSQTWSRRAIGFSGPTAERTLR